MTELFIEQSIQQVSFLYVPGSQLGKATDEMSIYFSQSFLLFFTPLTSSLHPFHGFLLPLIAIHSSQHYRNHQQIYISHGITNFDFTISVSRNGCDSILMCTSLFLFLPPTLSQNSPSTVQYNLTSFDRLPYCPSFRGSLYYR